MSPAAALAWPQARANIFSANVMAGAGVSGCMIERPPVVVAGENWAAQAWARLRGSAFIWLSRTHWAISA